MYLQAISYKSPPTKCFNTFMSTALHHKNVLQMADSVTRSVS